jgi:hypothetical protein
MAESLLPDSPLITVQMRRELSAMSAEVEALRQRAERVEAEAAGGSQLVVLSRMHQVELEGVSAAATAKVDALEVRRM